MPSSNDSFDVLIIGGGHAGCEAALAAARMGANTALVSMSLEDAACMPCNPSVGGIAKSHLVFELDALGGEIARNADYTGIQFRVLNTRKGPAVQANRVQCDKQAYSRRMQVLLAQQSGLALIAAEAASLCIENGSLRGIVTADGSRIQAATVVITAGTFLGGRIHIGSASYAGGRSDAPSSDRLSSNLAELGMTRARLKTGTPPRLTPDSINYEKMTLQPGLQPPPFFSQQARILSRGDSMFHVEHSSPGNATGVMFHVEHSSSALAPWTPGTNQLPCYLTHTNEQTHDIIERNLKRSSLYGGQIGGTGVRYCPSIEDKIVKFSGKSSHHVFIEPEGRGDALIYPNGISNSLPEAVQVEMVHSIEGLERAQIVRYGYAIEYDFVDPTELTHSLESKAVENLFLAGQVNGTTGYEEAAALGFLAGVNAVRKVRKEKSFVLARDEAYMGVLVDDLVTKGTDEPYRMFTSRAEYRLLLRQDNAHFRLLSHAQQIGIVPLEFIAETKRDASAVSAEITRLGKIYHDDRSLLKMLRQPGTGYTGLPDIDKTLSRQVHQQVETEVKYAGYIQRERKAAERLHRIEDRIIPPSFDYWAVTALRYECREKLSRIRPDNLGQASRVPGVNPADIAVLSVAIKR